MIRRAAVVCSSVQTEIRSGARLFRVRHFQA